MNPPLVIFTIVLDGAPWIYHHLPVFNTLRIPWRWIIVEGAAMNVRDTSWCAPQQPRLSKDGTTEYLNELKRHPRITVIQRPRWEGKTEMVNTSLSLIREPCFLLQVDADELWTAPVIENVYFHFLEHQEFNCARFFCKYFVGINIVTVGDDCWGNRNSEWLRFFRFIPGQTFARHEPPVLMGVNEPGLERCISREQTKQWGWTFEHYAYSLLKQVEYKEKFYKYHNAVEQWKKLQANTQWPVKRLVEFLPWATYGNPGADLHCK